MFLENVINNIEFDNPDEQSVHKGNKKALELIKRAIDELKLGHSLLNHETDDYLGFFDGKTKKVVTIEKS